MSGDRHVPVLLNEAIDALQIRPDGVYVDATFGRGGHSREILRRLSERGRLIALDRDAQAINAGREINDGRLQLVQDNFSHLRSVLEAYAVEQVEGVLLDLGVSSPQLDNVERGFSFRFDGPLDMRMDNTRGQTAATWLANASESEIMAVVRDHGEERFAKQIAAAIVKQRDQFPSFTTCQLAHLVAGAVRTREPGQHPATRTFQALRIHVNEELTELNSVLPQCAQIIKSGGRLVVISFHSLEDRIVKRFMRECSRASEMPRKLPLRAADLPPPLFMRIGRARHAADIDVKRNPRARSAVMRVAERTAAPWRGAV